MLLAERSGDTTTLTLNRPERRNALSPDLVSALQAALDAAGTDGTRVLVLRGAGPAFCAGFDFSDIDSVSEAELEQRFVAIERVLYRLYSAPFDTVALVHRAAMGAGADLVASCVHRVAEPAAKLRFPGARFGLVLGTRRLGLRVGAHAGQALVGGEAVGADEAQRMGLLTQLADEHTWPGVVSAVAEHARQTPAFARAAVLAALRPDDAQSAARDQQALVDSVRVPGLKARIQHYIRTHSR